MTKLATLRDGTRDGQLAVVARDLKTAHLADGIAPTLQAALDDWAFIAPQLRDLYQLLNGGRAKRVFDFDTALCMAPLPRAFQRVDGGAWAQGEEPSMSQCASDALAGPQDDIVLAHESWGIDVGAGIAVITDDVPAGVTPDEAHGQIRLLLLLNEISLRNLAPDELARAGGLLQSRPGASCSPVAITPDELGEEWQGGKVHLSLRTSLNGKLLGQLSAARDMTFNFPQLIAHLCKTRGARAGTIVGAGTVAAADAKAGFACIADRRAHELLADGVASTPFMLFGDRIKIDMLDTAGASLFGAIDQTVKQSELRKSR